MPAPIVLEARNVTKSFGVTPVLRNLDFKLPLGSRYAIMGPSGSGKSTFLNCCSGIEHPDTGSLTITGTELSDSSPNELVELRKRSIGYVFQSFNLLQTLTAFENIELPVQLLGLSKSERCDRVNSLLEKVGLAHRAHSYRRILVVGSAKGLPLRELLSIIRISYSLTNQREALIQSPVTKCLIYLSLSQPNITHPCFLSLTISTPLGSVTVHFTCKTAV